MSGWSGRTGVAIALLAVASCTSPRDTIVEQPPVTTIVVQPGTTEPGVTEPGMTQPDTSQPVTTEPETTEPDTTEPDTTDPVGTEPGTSEPPTSEPTIVDSGAPAPDVALEENEDDRNETSLLAAVIGLLGFTVLLVFAARWMVRLDDRRDGDPTHPRDPDDGLPSDQMSL